MRTEAAFPRAETSMQTQDSKANLQFRIREFGSERKHPHSQQVVAWRWASQLNRFRDLVAARFGFHNFRHSNSDTRYKTHRMENVEDISVMCLRNSILETSIGYSNILSSTKSSSLSSLTLKILPPLEHRIHCPIQRS
ncbi:hypothetical protein GYH30_010815 [Glycine max]|uniref:Uncharacterized protein n=1 Tax=Glycine max TaxID=3847 RepID=A0A0R0KBJ5_SOYBN|nr:hypothetical protein GYH30_010815 [Glycine max]